MSEYVRLSAECEKTSLAIIVPRDQMALQQALMDLYELAPKAMCWSCEPWPGPSHRSES